MKRLLSFFALGVIAVIAIAATVKISDLPLATNPSTNTYIEIADMNAVTKSSKFLFNGVTYKAVTNGMSWSGNTNNVIGGDGHERTISSSGQPASATLTNLSNGIGTDLTNLLAAAVQAAQTNVVTTNFVAKTGDTMTGALTMQPGNYSTPQIKVDGFPLAGLAFTGGGFTDTAGDGSFVFGANQYGVGVPSLSIPFFIGPALEVQMFADSANVVQLGVDGALPFDQALKAADGTGTDTFAAGLSLEGGQSTGTGKGGKVSIKTSGSSSSSSTKNTYEERAQYVPGFTSLSNTVATTVLRITIPDTNSIGLIISATINAGDGTNFQSQTDQIILDAVAKSTNITSTLTVITNATATSSGTLAVAWTLVDTGTNVLNLTCAATSSLTPTLLRAKLVIPTINVSSGSVLVAGYWRDMLIMFDGDSRTYLYTPNWVVPCLANAVFSTNSIGWLDVAEPQQTIAQRNAAAPTELDPYYVALGSSKICVIWAGVNGYTESAADLWSDLQAYCAARHAVGWKVVLCTEIDGNPPGWSTTYLSLNTLIKASGTSVADAIVDLGANVNLQDYTNTTYFTDGLHLTAAGDSIVAAMVAPVIASLKS